MKTNPISFKAITPSSLFKRKQKTETENSIKVALKVDPEAIKKSVQTKSIEISQAIKDSALTNSLVAAGRKNDVKELTKNFTPEAREIYDNIIEIAIKDNSKEIKTYHAWVATLSALKTLLQELEDGTIEYSTDERRTLGFELSALITPAYDFIQESRYRKIILKIIDKYIERAQKEFLDKNEKSKKLKLTPYPSEYFVDDLISANKRIMSFRENQQDETFYDCQFLSTCASSKDKKLFNEVKNFIYESTISIILEDDLMKPDNNRHLGVYDKKADSIWKNISYGNNVVVLCSDKNNDCFNHLMNDFAALIKDPKRSYNGFEKDKTNILSAPRMVPYFNLFIDLIRNTQKENEKTGEKTIIIIDLDKLLILCERNVGSAGIELLKDLTQNKLPNVRVIFKSNPENFQEILTHETNFAKLIGQFMQQVLPSIDENEALKYLADENGIRYIEEKIGKKIDKDAIEEAVLLTKENKGNYPDKVLDLINSVALYSVDSERLTKDDIIRYIKETKELSDTSNNDDEIDLIFDTKKTIDDIVGTPMTKAAAKTIVNQIKKGTIGTKGILIYRADGSSYGGGRRHVAEAIAGEAKIPMFVINAADFALKDIDALSQNANLSEIKIKNIISKAKAQAKMNPDKTAMIFIENFERFASNPLYGISSIYEQKAFFRLLQEMEKTRKEEKINLLVMGSVNYPETIDDNIRKPNKFLETLEIYSPEDNNQRKEVIEYYLNKLNIEIDSNTQQEKERIISDYAATLDGFTLIDVVGTLEKAKEIAFENNRTKIKEFDLREAFLQRVSGIANPAFVSEHENKIITSHEAGHALCLQLMYEIAEKSDIPWHLPNLVDFITLDRRGDFGGAMFARESINKQYSFEAMMADIICDYGGHAAEKTLYNMVGSWGITADMQMAARSAELGVTVMGMGPKTGVRHIVRKMDGTLDVSEKKKQDIEDDIELFLSSSEKIANRILKEYKGFVEEFSEKYYSKANKGAGECIISRQEFVDMLNSWRQKQTQEKTKRLEDLNKEIVQILEQAKTRQA